MSLAVYQPADAGLFTNNPIPGLLAAAWKSVTCRAALALKGPLRISTAILPCVLKGFVPVTLCLLILRTTLVITALSGSELVLKCRMERYCCFVALSPRMNVAAAGLVVPPWLLVSLDSSTQPSGAAPDFNWIISKVFVGVCVVVAINVGVEAVKVAVGDMVIVGDGVAVVVGLAVGVRDAVGVDVGPDKVRIS